MTWMFTYTGRIFDFADALAGRPCDVHIEDIARSLADRSRFGGHLERRVSVAEHSCIVAMRCGEIADKRGFGSTRVRHAEQLGFSHDFQETYLGDWISPIKMLARARDVDFLDMLEDAVMVRVHEAFLLDRIRDPELDAIVKRADTEALAYEKAHLAPKTKREWAQMLPAVPRSMRVRCLGVPEAYALFMSHAERLGFA